MIWRSCRSRGRRIGASRWGEVDHSDPKQPLSVAVAACVFPAKMIIIDRRWLKGRTAEHFTETVLHELSHMRHRETDEPSHGPQFERTLARVKQYFQAPGGADARGARHGRAVASTRGTRPPLAPASHARDGQRWRRDGWVTAPGLDPTLEYRG